MDSYEDEINTWLTRPLDQLKEGMQCLGLPEPSADCSSRDMAMAIVDYERKVRGR